MELFKYIVKFIYRIRWWMVIFPCIAGIIAVSYTHLTLPTIA